MLDIKDLHASINGKEILKGINLTVKTRITCDNGAERFRKRVRFLLFWWGNPALR